MLYAAPGNRLKDDGTGDFNAVLVNQPARAGSSGIHPGGSPFLIDFIGGNPHPPDWRTWPDTVDSATGVVVGAYAVDRDFNVVLENPVTGDLFQARLLGDPPVMDMHSLFTVRDLTVDSFHYPFDREQPPDKNQYVAYFLENHRLEELIQPGDMVHVELSAELGYPIVLDGVQVASALMVERLDGVKRLTALFG